MAAKKQDAKNTGAGNEGKRIAKARDGSTRRSNIP